MQGGFDRLERGLCGIEGVSLRDKYGMKLEETQSKTVSVCGGGRGTWQYRAFKERF